jgi:hypothetical protein
MLEYESFVYLDIQKTASTFILALLQTQCRETLVREKRHRGMDADCDRSKFYFISVRDPLDAYLSLYSFGCEKSGGLRENLRRRELGDLYDGTLDGFERWLALVLRPRKAALLGSRYAGMGRIAELAGYQSYRYLKLALPDANAILTACETESDVRAAYATHKLPGFIVRYESLIADLGSLIQGPLRHAMTDLDAALRYLQTAPVINPSRRIDANARDFTLKKRLRERLYEREWFLGEIAGYGRN